MTARLRSWWQSIRKHRVVAIIIATVTVFMLFICLAYWLKWDWTGFNEHIGPNVQQYQPAKTLWDWFNLLGVLAIPAAVGFGTIWFTRNQGEVSDRENTDNQREAALQAYIDKMSELLLEKQLRESAEDAEVRTIARVRTLTVLRGLDAARKGSVIQFLYEAGLIGRPNQEDRIVFLMGADLSGADLHGVNLEKANLTGADLRGTNFRFAELAYVDFTFTDLRGANLSQADFQGASLDGANLEGANLLKALVLASKLDKASSLQGATMPDGSIHP